MNKLELSYSHNKQNNKIKKCEKIFLSVFHLFFFYIPQDFFSISATDLHFTIIKRLMDNVTNRILNHCYV